MRDRIKVVSAVGLFLAVKYTFWSYFWKEKHVDSLPSERAKTIDNGKERSESS